MPDGVQHVSSLPVHGGCLLRAAAILVTLMIDVTQNSGEYSNQAVV